MELVGYKFKENQEDKWKYTFKVEENEKSLLEKYDYVEKVYDTNKNTMFINSFSDEATLFKLSLIDFSNALENIQSFMDFISSISYNTLSYYNQPNSSTDSFFQELIMTIEEYSMNDIQNFEQFKTYCLNQYDCEGRILIIKDEEGGSAFLKFSGKIKTIDEMNKSNDSKMNNESFPDISPSKQAFPDMIPFTKDFHFFEH